MARLLEEKGDRVRELCAEFGFDPDAFVADEVVHAPDCDLGEDCTCGAIEDEPEYRCLECGGSNLQHVAWVDVNTDAVGDLYGSWCYGDNNRCLDCDAPTRFVSLRDGEEWTTALAKAGLVASPEEVEAELG